MSEPPLAMFDRVRIRSTQLTEQMGIAGMIGQIQGRRVPSRASAGVIGLAATDMAFKVVFGDRILTATSGPITTPPGFDDLWFAPEVLEFVGTTPAIRISPKGISLVRDESGNWVSPGPGDGPTSN